jgi:hypothetical protein
LLPWHAGLTQLFPTQQPSLTEPYSSSQFLHSSAAKQTSEMLELQKMLLYIPVILTNTHNQMQGVMNGTHYANSLQAQKSLTITTKKCLFNQV